MARLRKIGVLFSAKLQALLMAFVGLVAGLLYAGIGAIVDALTIGLNVGTALAFFALIGMPITFATFGFVAGAIGALLYNPFAGRIGGIEMDFEE